MIDLYEINPYQESVVKSTGYKSIKSLMLLYWLVNKMTPEYVLELGTGKGCSAIFMALGNAESKIITVDNYLMDANFNDREAVEKAFKLCKVKDNIIIVEGDTRSFKQGYKDKKFEMIFMDASHNIDDLMAEYTSFIRYVTDDYIIIIDDLNAVLEGKATVRKFFSSLSKSYAIAISLNFHNGMGILATSFDKHLERINDAIWRANHA